MRSAFILFLLLLKVCLFYAQDFLYYGLNNFGGVAPVFQNPANIADSRSRWDLILLGNYTDFGNNYIGLKPSAIKGYGWLDFKNPNFSDTAFKSKYLVRMQNGYQKGAFLNMRLLLPSFMINLSEKHSIAFTWSIRSLLNVYNVNQQLADLMYSDIRDSSLFTGDNNYRISLAFNTFAEYSGTYARVLYKKEKHFVKAGISLKLLQGLGSVYAYADPLKYRFTSDTTLDIYNSNISYGHSNNFDLAPDWLKRYSFSSLPGFGADIGLVYEFRPKYWKYQFKSTDGATIERRDLNKYLLKFSASVVDIGHITYKKSSNSNDFFANTTNWKFRNIAYNKYPIAAIDDTLKNRFGISSSSSTYKMYLPRTLILQADLNLIDNLYFNITSGIDLRKKIFLANSRYNTHHFSIRYERKHISGAVSFNYNDFMSTVNQPWSIGAAFQLWFLSIGTTNLNNFLYKRDIYGMNFFVLIKTTPHIFKRPDDKDKDKVPDIADFCPTIAGNIKTKGCPDTDNDGIPDIQDKCPDKFGLDIFEGCPDTDKDSIPDTKDECPDAYGKKLTNGCPDKDNDGVADKTDECPDKAGIIKCKGCPYLDFEGIVLNTYNANDITKDKIKVYLLDTLLNKLDSTFLDGNGKFSFDCVQGKYNTVLVMLDNNDNRVTSKAKFYLMDPESKEIRRITKRYGKYNYVFGELPLTKYDWYDLKGDGKLTIGGVLMNADNNQPIANKKIYIKNDKGDIMDSTTTNQLGSFVFRYLEYDQKYMVFFGENDPTLSPNMKILLTNKEGKVLKTILYNNYLKRFDFELLTYDKTLLKDYEIDDLSLNLNINAILTDIKKNPLENVKIYVFSAPHKDSLVQVITTDDLGYFKLNNMKFMKGAFFLVDEKDTKLTGLFVVLILDKQGRVIKKLIRNQDGSFKFNLLDIEKTTLTEHHIDDPWLGALSLKKKNLTVIENIIYPSNEYRVTKEGERILAKVATILKENPKLFVEIGSHTDSRANDTYNLKLSQKRAQYVVDYLVKMGIDKSRLKAVGYGETQILNHCKNGVKCTDAEHAINRRTEFKLKEMEQ